MKKYFVGFLVGAILTMSTSVFAEEIKSLIGQKVQGTAVVSLNGKDVGSAVIINGTSYAPVRVIGEASGLNVGYDSGVVKLSDTEPVQTIAPTETPSASATPIPTATPTRSTKSTAEDIKLEIEQYKKTIKVTNEAIDTMKTSISSGNYSGEKLQYLNDHLAIAEKRVSDAQNQIKILEARLTEVQGQ
jgi:hypothetical protein